MSYNTDTPGMSYALSSLGVKGNPDLPIADSSRILGGGWSVATLELRNMIPATLRKEGVSRCYVAGDRTYILIGGIDNVNWIPEITSGHDGINADQLVRLMADQIATVGTGFSFTVPIDVYGQNFTIVRVSNLPAGLSYTDSTHLIAGTPNQAGPVLVVIDYQNPVSGKYSQYILVLVVNAPVATTPTSTPAATVGAANIDLVWNPIADNPYATGNAVDYDYDLALQLTESSLAEAGQRAVPGSSDARYIGSKSISGAIALAALGSSLGGTTQQRFVRFAISLAVLRTLYPNQITAGFAIYGKRKTTNPTDGANNKISAVTINRTKTSGIIAKTPGNNVDFTTNGDALSPVTTSTGWYVGAAESLLFNLTINLSTGELILGTQAAPANKPPTVTNPAPDGMGTVGASYTQVLPANEFNDSDGTIASIVATGLPPGLTYDAPNHTITGTATAAGGYNVSITATDNQGASVVDQVLITIATAQPPANQAPYISNPAPDATGVVGAVYSQVLPANEFTDPDGRIASTVASNLPPGLTYDAPNHTIGGTPTTTGTYTVGITATDNQGASVTDYLVITIQAQPNQTYQSNGSDYYA